jgi:hypothetical protein
MKNLPRKLLTELPSVPLQKKKKKKKTQTKEKLQERTLVILEVKLKF